jgi:MFS superfamily sulfate permease-like transporter
VVPQAIAYAQIAGLPPKAGLFAAFAGLLGYGLLGTCRQLIVSSGLAGAIGRDHLYRDVEDAIADASA